MVFLKLRPYRHHSLAKCPYEKLVARFYGPFKILQRMSKVAYKLELSPTSNIHPIFHVSQLRRARGLATVSPTTPRRLSANTELLVEPDQLLGIRSKTHGSPGELEVLIKW